MMMDEAVDEADRTPGERLTNVPTTVTAAADDRLLHTYLYVHTWQVQVL